MTAERAERADALTADTQGATIDAMTAVPDAQRSGRPRQLLEARATHEATLVLLVEHPLRFGQQGAVLPRRRRGHDVDLDLHRHVGLHLGTVARHLVPNRALGREAIDSHLPMAERFDQLERQRPGTQDPRPPVTTDRIVDLPMTEIGEDTPIRE